MCVFVFQIRQIYLGHVYFIHIKKGRSADEKPFLQRRPVCVARVLLNQGQSSRESFSRLS